MSASRPRELVRASAGSGKTFRISSRIISLLAADIRPASILASTFTRKAAGEILARVLARLAEGASGLSEARTLGGHTGFPDADPEFWRGVLARTMRAVHELDVGTLDSFFSRAVRSFSHDLGLPAGWTVADEATADRVRSRALERTLDSARRGEMVELVRGMRGGDVRRSVHEGLSSEVDQILEIHRDLAPDGPGWRALEEILSGLGDPEPRDPADLREELGDLELPTTESGSPRAGWVKAIAKLRELVDAGKWAEVGAHTLVQRALDPDGGVYYSAEVEGPTRDTLAGIARDAGHHLLRDHVRRAGAMAALAQSYEEALDRTLRGEGVLRFDDVTRLLAGDHGLTGGQEMGYRLDSGTRHLLLDEFQDTSLMQWKALRPLTDSLLGESAPADRSAVVVADPKQSIYGWRGAAPVVVDALAGHYELTGDTLDTSWRSSRVVLDTVNRVFRSVEDAPTFDREPVDRETAAAWRGEFRPHEPARALPGHVTLCTGPELSGRRASQPLLMRHAALRIRELHFAAPGRSIGVLVRRTDAVARLILELRDLGVPASEEGGTRLVDSAAVVSVLALLRLADHPGNRLARYHVAGTPVGATVGYHDPLDEAGAHRVARDLRARLLHRGYGPTLAGLRDALLPACDARDTLRLGQLVELGYRHDQRPSLRVDDFVHTAARVRVESGGTSPVRVMTLWGSKGLEFDMVVLPQLYLGMTDSDRGGGPPLGYRPDPAGMVTHAFPPASRKAVAVLARFAPELPLAWEQHRAAGIRDALSGLYVAMTRARYALHMIVPAEPEKPRGAKTPALLLRWSLDPQAGTPTVEGECLFEAGDPEWHRNTGKAADREEVPAATGRDAGVDRIPLKHAVRRTRMLPRHRPSDHGPARDAQEEAGAPEERAPTPVAGSAGVDLDRLLGLEGWDRTGVPATVRGSVVHAWLEEVEWLEDGFPDEDLRSRLARREAPELAGAQLSDLVTETWEWLQDRLARPEIQSRLTQETVLDGVSRDHPGATLRVERELPFYRRDGDALVEGIIDRLVVVEADGRPVAAHVLDYKTDRVSPGDEGRLAERTALYAPQLRAYREAVAESYRIPAAAVRLTLLFLEAGKAVEVE